MLVGPRNKYFTVHLPRPLRSWSCSQTQANMVRRSSAFPCTPRPPQDAPKTATRRPRGPQDFPKTLKRTPKAPPKSSKSYLRDLPCFCRFFENPAASLCLLFHVDQNWAPEGLQIGPETPKDASRRPTASNMEPTWGQHGVQEKRQDRSQGPRNLAPR